MRWTWDAAKNRHNERRHRIGFALAALVFTDPLAATRPDASAAEERWHTIGAVRGVLLLVVHTWPVPDATGEDVGRIISARKATRHERQAYEEGQF